MSRLDFHIEFKSEVALLDSNLMTEAEERLRALAEDRRDLIGAAVAVEELAREQTPHFFQARVVLYIRPENIAAVEKADTLDLALKSALNAVERQVHERRAKLAEPWQQPEQVTDQGIYELEAEEIYDSFARRIDAAKLLDMDRTELATRLMLENDLDEAAAFYAADQIMTFAQEFTESQPPS